MIKIYIFSLTILINLFAYAQENLEVKNVLDASKNGNIEQLKIILKKSNNGINLKDKNGNTALIISTMAKNKKIISLLISSKANLELKHTKSGKTALMYASQLGSLDVVDMLLNAGANINNKDADGDTALGWALEAKGENLKIIKKLLDAKVDINNRGYRKKTPLALASEYQKENVVKL